VLLTVLCTRVPECGEVSELLIGWREIRTRPFGVAVVSSARAFEVAATSGSRIGRLGCVTRDEDVRADNFPALFRI
jgi:hypothetical protein